MMKMWRILTAVFFLLPITIVQAGTEVSSVRMWDAPDNTRIVFDLDKPTGFSVFTLNNPARVVIDLFDTRLKSDIPNFANGHMLLRGIRSAQRNSNTLRVVLDTTAKVDPKSFLLKPNEEYGHRLVVDLDHPLELQQQKPTELVKPEEVNKPSESKSLRDIVVAIDAGHGGEDPGARGKYGTMEKDVTLKIAQKLAEMINRESGMRAVLIRSSDYYVSLRKRINIAREHKADLFVSIHADAYSNRRVQGASVYVLSARGASDEASRWLEQSENAADLVGGVSLDDKDDVLASVLLDLSLTGTIDVSTRIADGVLDEISKVGPVRKKDVQFARFVVLKSPDIPSMLVETAFISNPTEERRLKDPAYQRRLASAMLKGIRKYFESNPPPDTRLAESGRTHRIRSGESLSSIANRYNVSVSHLKKYNDIRGNVVMAGQTLNIPF